MKTLILLFAFFFIALISNGQTNISGSVFTSTTWTMSGSPYILSGNVVVFEGVQLTIEPGVVVKFDSGAGFELRGKISAIGTVSNPIKLTSNLANPTKGSWNGIKVIGTTNPLGVGNQVTMEYVKCMYASIFINLDLAYHGPYFFKHCYFADNYSVNKDGGMPSTIFENCQFVSNNDALTYCQFESRASHCDFINNINGLNGIKNVDSCYFTGNTGIALSPYGSTTGCKVENNNIGVSCPFNSSNNVFTDNVVINNQTGIEILSFFNGSHIFTGNTFCNNTSDNVKLLTNNNANIPNNCWCTSDSSQIRANIYDGYINNSHGLVNFMPFSTNCPQNPLNISNTPSMNNENFIVFPNPFQNTLTFSSNSEETFTIHFFDLTGRKVLQQKFSKRLVFNTENLISGLYIYNVQNDMGIIYKGKLIKD